MWSYIRAAIGGITCALSLAFIGVGLCHSQQQLSEVSSLSTMGVPGSDHVDWLGSKHFCPLGHVISFLDGSLDRLPLEPHANLLAFCDLTHLSPFAHCDFGLSLSTPGCGFPDKMVL